MSAHRIEGPQLLDGLLQSLLTVLGAKHGLDWLLGERARRGGSGSGTSTGLLGRERGG